MIKEQINIRKGTQIKELAKIDPEYIKFIPGIHRIIKKQSYQLFAVIRVFKSPSVVPL